MSHELRIIFEGVMVLGPPYPQSGPDEAPGPLYAVLPRVMRHESRFTKDPDPPAEPRPAMYIPAHFPVLFTDLTPTNDSRKRDDQQRNFSIWYPMRERLTFRFSPSATPDNLRYIRGPAPACAASTDPGDPLHNIANVPDMRDVFPSRSRLRSGTLSAPPSVSELVAAQVFVPSGCIGSHGEFLKTEAAEANFLPSRSTTPGPRHLHPQVVVSVQTDRVDISMYSLDTGELLDPIAFDLQAGRTNILRVANADPYNVRYVIEKLADPQFPEPTGIKPRVGEEYVDIDFEACYRVLGGLDMGGELPIPRVHIRFGERNCNAAFAEPPTE
jgi:hypothetical protein